MQLFGPVCCVCVALQCQTVFCSHFTSLADAAPFDIYTLQEKKYRILLGGPKRLR